MHGAHIQDGGLLSLEIEPASMRTSTQVKTLVSEYVPGRTRCWWCVHPFRGEPIQVPRSFCHWRCKGDKGRWLIEGYFCSKPCARAWHQAERLDTPLKYFWREQYGHAMTIPILSAPDRKLLRAFGGPWTIATFRKMTKDDDAAEWKVLRAPHARFVQCFEVRPPRGKMISTDTHMPEPPVAPEVDQRQKQKKKGGIHRFKKKVGQ